MFNRSGFEKYYQIWTWTLLCWIVPGISALGLSIAAITLSLADRMALTKLAVCCTLIFACCLTGAAMQIAARMVMCYNVVIFKDLGRLGNFPTPKPIAFRIDSSFTPGSEPYRKLLSYLTILSQKDFVADIEKALERRVRRQGGAMRFVRFHDDMWKVLTVLNYHSKGFHETLLDDVVRGLGGISKDRWLNISGDTETEWHKRTVHELAHFILEHNFKWDRQKQDYIIFEALQV
jgi:hypothetical protein